MSESWTHRDQNGEPSTPVVDIMDGSFLKHEPTYEALLSRRSLRWRHQPPREGMRRVGLRRWCARYVFIVMERGRRDGTSFLRTRPSQTAFGSLPLVPRAASPAKCDAIPAHGIDKELNLRRTCLRSTFKQTKSAGGISRLAKECEGLA